VNFEGIEPGVTKAESEPRDDNGYYNGIPMYPIAPCQCGCDEFWLTTWKQWVCMRCHPKPRDKGGEIWTKQHRR